MPYCSRCGVEVDGHVTECPLCNTPIQRLEDVDPGEPRYPADEHGDEPPVSDRLRRRILWEILTLSYVIAVLVVIGSDLRVDGKIGWSLYPTAALVLVWVYTTLIVFFRRRIGVVAVGGILATVAFLAAVNLVSGRLDWFFSLGLPICALFVVIAVVIVFAAAKSKQRGFNIVAFVFLGIAAFSVGVDALVSRHLTGGIHFSWSVIVLLALIPLALIFLFLHYRLRNRFDIRRIFHF